MHVVHPVADEWTDEHYVWAASARHVVLSAPLATFLDAASTDRVRPILVTNADATLSPTLGLALRRAGAHWAVRTDHGTFDGLSGYRIDSFADLWRRSGVDRERLPGFDRPAAGAVGVVMFDVHAHSRAVDSTTIGAVAEAVVVGLGGSPLQLWGPYEPLLEPWDIDEITAVARRQMPESGPLHGAGPGGEFVDVLAARTRHGVLERAKGWVPVGPYPRSIGELIERSTRALTAVSERFRPTIAFCSLAQLDPGPVQAATGKAPEVPLAVLIGPRAVHDLELDVASLAERHDLVVLGRGRMPAVLVRFSAPDVGLWAQLVAFAHDVGPARVAAALGLDGAV